MYTRCGIQGCGHRAEDVDGRVAPSLVVISVYHSELIMTCIVRYFARRTELAAARTYKLADEQITPVRIRISYWLAAKLI